MAASTYLNKALELVQSQLRLDGGVTVETLAGTYTFSAKSPNVGYFDPDSSNRNMQLLAEEVSKGWFGIYANSGTSGNLVFLNDAAGTVATVGPGEFVILSCDGSAWGAVVGISEAGAHTWTTLQTFSAGAALIDSTSYIYDNADSTKRVAFQVSGVTTATTRTKTFQDTNGTLAEVGATSGATAPAFTGTAPTSAVELAAPVFSGTGQTSAGQVITTTDNQTMTLNQCAGMWFVSAEHGPYLIASNTAVTGAPAVLTIYGTAPTTDAGTYKILRALTPAGSVASHTHTNG